MASLNRHKTIFTTERGLFHQERALVAAPESLDVVMLREPDRETLLAQLADAEFFISERTGVIDAEMIQAAPKLKLILRLGSLTYDIDTEAAKARGVAVCYWPVEGVIRVAEHMVMQMLVLAKRLRNAEAIALQASPEWGESRRGDEDTFAYNWSNRQGIQQLWGRTVGILGFGEIGAELARRLDGWGCALLYNKRRRLPETVEQELKLNYVDMDTLTSQSDYLAMLLPYSKIMDMSVNAATFARMKDGAFFVSAGSGSIIDEAALAEAVKSGKLGGAALDTYEWEPIRADNPLIALAKEGHNILLTPHTAAGSYTARISDQERREDYTNIVRFLKGEPLMYRVV